MNEQEIVQSIIQRPIKNDLDAWKAYWKAQNQSWRIEPEIDRERQKYLSKRLAIVPDIDKGIYPFKDIKLSRSDVEWLLATHGSGHGPVNWDDVQQRTREGLDMRGANLQQIDLSYLPLARLNAGLSADVSRQVPMEQSEMAAAHLEKAFLYGAHLESANLSFVHLEDADLSRVHLEEADLSRAHLERTNLTLAHLNNAELFEAQLEGANLTGAQLEGTNLSEAHLGKINLLKASLSDQKQVGPSFADVSWNDVNLTVMDWSQVQYLGDEYRAREKVDNNGKNKNKETRLVQLKRAVRANRQLAVALRDQGLNEEADRFLYRAQILQRIVWRQQRRFLKYIFSWFLYLLAGYGYRPLRSLMIYLIVIVCFALGFYETTHVLNAQPYPLSWYEAVVLSVSSFHGRGFFQPLQSLGDPVTILAAIEAVLGLIIEISFIATFTQRYFGK